MYKLLIVILLNLLFLNSIHANPFLESPQQGSIESGIGLIRGWACDATAITILIDNIHELNAAYGTSRGDTVTTCGDDDNGFGITFNWNLIGNGQHTLKAIADGNEFANISFQVKTLGSEFITAPPAMFTLDNFPHTGESVDILWSQAHQGFVLFKPGMSGNSGFPGDETHQLESPQVGLMESGIGLIRGWACDAKDIFIEIDGQHSFKAAYGTSRADTLTVCGDTNNGFGITVNWNLFGDGEHRIKAFSDGQEFADVFFNITTLGAEFLTGIAQRYELSNFPSLGNKFIVSWSETHQNFIIADFIAKVEDHAYGVDDKKNITDVVLSSDGNTAFVLTNSHLEIINVSDPSAIYQLSTSTLMSWPRALVLSNDNKTVYIADHTSGLRVFDVSDVYRPVQIAISDLPIIAFDIAISDDNRYVYVVDSIKGMTLFDITNPSRPIVRDQYSSKLIKDITLDNNTAYLVEEGDEFFVLDVSDPNNVTERAKYMDANFLTFFLSIATYHHSNRFLVGSGNSDVLMFKNQGTRLSNQGSFKAKNIRHMELSSDDKTVFIADGEKGFKSYTLFDTSAQLLKHYPTVGFTNSFAITRDESKAFVATDSGLQVFKLN